MYDRDVRTLLHDSLQKKYVCLLIWIGISLLPVDLLSQTEAGAISRSQCVTSGGTPANLTSLRIAVDMGLGFYWESADDAGFTTGLVSNLSPNSQTFTMTPHTTNTYYRRVVPTGLSPPSDFYYSNVIKISIVGALPTPAPTFVPTSVSPICQGNTSFTVSYFLIGSPAKYSIIWDAAPAALGFIDVLEQNLPGSSPLTINVSSTAPAGTYSGTLIPLDANGCSLAGTNAGFTFNPLPTPTISPGSTTIFCAGGSVNLTATAASSYSWSTGENTQSVMATTAGGRTVTITDVNGCSATSSATNITVNALPTPTITPGGTTTFCVGGSVSLTAIVASFYSWNTGETTQTALATTSGGRTVTITDVNGCSAKSSVTTVTVNPLPPAIITTLNPTTFCAGDSVTLTASTASLYSWNTGETTQSVLATTSGGRTVTITDVNGCSAKSSVTAVTVIALPTAIITTLNPTTFCAGGSVTLTASTASSYSWNTGETTQTALATTSGGRTVTITDVNGCSNKSPVITVTINPLPTAIITTLNPTTFCAGGSVTLTASTASSYSWSTGQTTQSILATTSGGRTVTITDVNGCSATSSATTVIVNPLPIATITALNPTAFCAGGSVTLTASAGTAYSWNTGAITQSISVNTAGNKTVSVTDANGCTATSVPVNIVVNPLPVLSITNPSAVCSPATVNLTLPAVTNGSTAGTNLSYWTSAAATNSYTTPSAVGLSGIYYIKAILSSTGCSSVQPVSVSVNAPPTINITNPAAVCEPATIDITATAVTIGSSADLTFTYWTNAANTNALTTAPAINTSGTYYIRGVSATECFASMPVSVAVNPLPNGILQTPAVNYICDGTPLVIRASNSFGYQWYSDQTIIAGATADTYAATKSGNYTVQFISQEGCTKKASNTIRLDLLTKPVIQFAANGACIQTPIVFTNNSNIAGSGGVSWLWDFGDGSSSNNFSATHTYSNAGTFNISLTANNASCSIFTEKKTIALLITAPQSAIRYDTINAVGGKSFSLIARSLGASYLWSPSTGLNITTTRSPLATLTKDIDYTVRISSSTGCITTDSVYVKVVNEGEIYVPKGFTPNNDGVNDRAYPILVGIRQLVYFKIFNRWGNLLFQTKDATPQNGWDGKVGGKIQPVATYAWTAEGIDGNGNIIHRSGNILLIN